MLMCCEYSLFLSIMLSLCPARCDGNVGSSLFQWWAIMETTMRRCLFFLSGGVPQIATPATHTRHGTPPPWGGGGGWQHRSLMTHKGTDGKHIQNEMK